MAIRTGRYGDKDGSLRRQGRVVMAVRTRPYFKEHCKIFVLC